MKKVIVYFHGYGSSPNSDKVTRLRQEKNWETYAFPINIDPVVAFEQLSGNIDMILADNPHDEDILLVFVGTSLGAWWASKMAKVYTCHAVLINPSIDPETSLLKYDVEPVICQKYHMLAPYHGNKYFFAENDEVIPNEEFRNYLIDAEYNVTVTPNTDHRFGGEAFEGVIKYINQYCAINELMNEINEEYRVVD